VGRASRDKGARGEREVADVFEAAGVPARRTAGLQAGERVEGLDVADADATLAVAGVHIEVKRCERIELPAWLRQAEADAPEGAEPVVAFRRNREPWRAVVRLDYLARLMSATREEG
jgi:Holliday junction resolvase